MQGRVRDRVSTYDARGRRDAKARNFRATSALVRSIAASTVFVTTSAPLSVRGQLLAPTEDDEGAPSPTRLLDLVAKATFGYDAAGRVWVDDQEPLALRDTDEATPGGLLPGDAAPRLHDNCAEVLLVGHAHAPGGRPVPQMRASLAVGTHRREILVVGDRSWRTPDQLSAPQPFIRMPMTIERAFGGICKIEIDNDSYLDALYAKNPHGTGYVALEQIEGLRNLLRPPAPYPRFKAPPAPPNLEDPARPIRTTQDHPMPQCWSAVPLGTAMHIPELGGVNPDAPANLMEVAERRCHPDWVLEALEPGQLVDMQGFDAQAPRIRFRVPRAEVLADVRAAGDTQSVDLIARRLTLHVDTRRFTVLWRARCNVPMRTNDERAVRFRLQGV